MNKFDRETIDFLNQHAKSGCQDQICKDLIHPKEFTFGIEVDLKHNEILA